MQFETHQVYSERFLNTMPERIELAVIWRPAERCQIYKLINLFTLVNRLSYKYMITCFW